MGLLIRDLHASMDVSHAYSTTTLEDFKVYVGALERYSSELDKKLTEIFERAKKVVEEQRKKQEEQMKRTKTPYRV